MKKKSLIPQYLLDELSNLVQKKDAYTKEDINQLSRDYDFVLKQREQLKEAEKYGTIPKEEAAITNMTLMVKQIIIQETTKDAVRYLEQEKEICCRCSFIGQSKFLAAGRRQSMIYAVR